MGTSLGAYELNHDYASMTRTRTSTQYFRLERFHVM